ncbi:NlpC/P60 family protein [Plantactinospora sp. B5E13]|uniref:C40 family peptidase n=1 Tax=unclassified Plantactinospora TaxID=2631981 RepID=UPI00325DC4C9
MRNLLRALVVAAVSAVLVAPMSVARAEPSVAELTQQINKASDELEKVVESYNKLNEDIKKSKAAAAELNARIGPLEQQVAQGRAEVAQIASRAYKFGGLSDANALLGRSAAANLVDRLGALEQLARDRDRQLSTFDATQRQYLDQKAELDATLARQNAQAKSVASQKKKIEKDLDKLYDMRREAYGSPTSYSGKYTGTIPKIDGDAGKAVTFAYNAIGTPYVYGADGPNGYDCSGLTSAAWRAAGKSLPHNAADQWGVVAKIGRGDLKPGDLVFYSGLGHVAIFVGSGKVIHAPTAGESVKLASVDLMTPYGYGRVR